MKKCNICKRELNSKIVYGSFMNFMLKICFMDKDWKSFNSCKECRDLYSSGCTIEDIELIQSQKYGLNLQD